MFDVEVPLLPEGVEVRGNVGWCGERFWRGMGMGKW